MFGLVLRSLRFYWRGHLGALAGAMLASAVLTGALLMGDSVDYSLRLAATQRLGNIHFAASTQNQYIQQALASGLAREIQSPVAAALQLKGMAIVQDDATGKRKQVNRVEVLGVDENFWSFSGDRTITLAPNETALNTKLAAALGVEVGDEVSLRVAKPALLARDAPLSWQGDERSRRGRYTVTTIVPDSELGRYSLSPSQVAPYNAFVNRAWLQEQVALPGRVNLLLTGEGASQEKLEQALEKTWKPEHLGMRLRAHESGVIALETDRVFFNAEMERAALTLPDAQGTLTYLVNSISYGEASTPYSFVVAGPVPPGVADDTIIINRWLMDHLGAVPGDQITMAYYEVLPSNAFVEKTREFTVRGLLEMDALSAERDLMPDFPGLSDVDSCSEWDVGMPMDEAMLNDEANEAYWDTYRQTPKAFVTLRAGQEMWANRFGNLTSVRYPGGPDDVPGIREALTREMDPALAGLVFQPVREQATAAVSEAMDFGGLFLGMSFFLIAAALMLTGLLFVFGVQQRASEMGALLALGYTPKRVRLLLLAEGLAIALLGALAGAGLGAYYARALLYGLGRYWQGAVANAAIAYHAAPGTLALGATISLVCAVLAMAIATWRLTKRPARELLNLDFTQDQPTRSERASGKRGLVLSCLGIALSVAIILVAQIAQIGEVTYAFFAAGSLLLMSGIGLFRHALIVLNTRGQSRDFTLHAMALQNVARRQGRSLAVVSLLACGAFLVFAVSAMQEDLHAHAHHRSSGTGGFALIAEATIPLTQDPLLELDQAEEISGTALRVRDGDDASCLNLNHAQTPKLLGVNVQEMARRGAFDAKPGDESIWNLLDLQLDGGVIPALVGDTNTTMWTLKKKAHLTRGDVLLYRDESGREVKVKLVGALPMRLSLFQGTILISDEAFTRLYPSESGHRMFLIDAPADQQQEIAAQLGRQFDRFGLDAVPAVQRLLEFYTVETTYLAMFLVLGGLGLAIGSAGMGVVVLRNLLERRGELAMLHALGYHHRPIYRILFTEYGFLLLAGLGIGAIAAAVSMFPAITATESTLALGIQLKLALLVLLTSAACMTLAILTAYRKNDPAALRNE